MKWTLAIFIFMYLVKPSRVGVESFQAVVVYGYIASGRSSLNGLVMALKA